MESPLKVGTLYVGGISKARNNKDVVEGEGESGSRFWMKMRYFVGCMALWSKPEGSSGRNRKQGTKSRNVNARYRYSVSPTTSNSETRSTLSISEELKAYLNLQRFSYDQLKLATRNFKPENFLGEGGFGSVFKGWINPNGVSEARPGMRMPVAVKTLNQEGPQGHREWLVWDLANPKYVSLFAPPFLAEVSYLGELHHTNLVKLVGYCIEDEQRLLVYEFMPRGSLEHHLFRRSMLLTWSIRMKILLGAAKGLAFLHEEAERPVIFRDFKTSNILLDADFNAKLSDFGLAKDAPEGDSTHVSTRVVGTYGYAAPEYVMTGHLTCKSDVYSFGVVLLEMLTGRRAVDKTRPPGEQKLVEWARPQLKNRSRLQQLMDPRFQGLYSVKGAHKALRLAALCLCHDPKARPPMSEVVQVLKSLTEMNDMATSTPSFQVRIVSPPNQVANKYGLFRAGSSSGSASSARNIPSRFQASPCYQNYPLPTPKRSGGRP